MEEKTRYEVIANKKNFIDIQDNESNTEIFFITEDNIEDLLNQQDQRIKELRKKGQQLKRQLAEKERQLELSEELLIKQEKEYDEQLEKQAKIYYKHLNQDKIEFAIEQLKEVKEYAYANYRKYSDYREHCYIDAVQLDKYIDNQINELK